MPDGRIRLCRGARARRCARCGAAPSAAPDRPRRGADEGAVTMRSVASPLRLRRRARRGRLREKGAAARGRASGAARAGRRSVRWPRRAVFAGEVKPRHETDLAFRIGGKIVERRVDVGARGEEGTGARAPRSGGRRAAGRRRPRRRSPPREPSSDFAQAEFERYQNLYRQKFVSESALDQKRNAMRRRRREARAGAGESRRDAQPGRLRDAGRDRRTASSRRSTPKRARSSRPRSR